MARRRRAGALHDLRPLRTAAHILALQLGYYVVAAVLVVFTALVAGQPPALDMLLGWDLVRGDTTQGWLMAFVWVFDGGFCMALAIVVLIARSKLVPDFAITVHAIHLLVVTLYAGELPRHSMWWAAMAASAAMSVVLATGGCRYRELQPVFFGGTGAGGGRGSEVRVDEARLEAGLGEDGEDDDGGTGRGKGRGRDGQGAYEMVKMGANT